MEGEIELSVCIPFLLPFAGISSSSEWLSIEVVGRDLGRAVAGRTAVDRLSAIDVCGRAPLYDPGRPPGPILLEKLPLEVLREDTDGVRDEEKDFVLGCIVDDFCN